MTQLVQFIAAHTDALIAIAVSLLTALSAVFQLLGKPGASKICGTLALDAGRVIRWLASRNVKPPSAPAVLVLIACGSLLLPLCTGCGKAALPTAQDAATLACNLTDTALKVAIDASTKAEAEKFVAPVKALGDARAFIAAKENVCSAVPALEQAVAAVDCDNCARAYRVAKAVCQ